MSTIRFICLRSVRFVCSIGVMALLAWTPSFADYRPESIAEGAPAETSQFAFLLGEWHCETENMRPDGSMVKGPNATWTGSLILGGWAIEDVWQSVAPSGAPSYGVNIRSFNPETEKWDNRWLAAGSLQWKYYEAERVGDTMVMTGGQGVDPAGREFLDRNVFHSFEADSWKWRKDRSYDGGESWIEGVARITAKRSADG